MDQLAPDLRDWLERYNFLLSRWVDKGHVQTVENVREGFAILTRTLVMDIPEISLVQDDMVSGHCHIPVRVYHPEPGKPLPVLVYLHGGGHMAGNIDVYDPICRKISLATAHIVISVEYRLAPENPYPAGIEDAMAVVKTYRDLLYRMGIRALPRLTVAGDSAGGAMSATLAHLCQQEADVEIQRLVLIYPSVDYTFCLPSLDNFATGYLLEKKTIQYYFDNYFIRGANRQDASPLSMKVSAGFPETLIITAGFCPLRDEGIQYRNILRNNGVPVCYLHFQDMIHTFLNLESVVPQCCRQVYEAMGEFLKVTDE